MEDNFDIVGSEFELLLNQNSNQSNDRTFQPTPFCNPVYDKKNFKNLYKQYHGSSTRVPGGNCIFESVLAYMTNEQIQNMIDTVEHFVNLFKTKNDKKHLADICEIFDNTPNSKYADLSAYMRAYVYLYCQINIEKEIDKCEIHDANEGISAIENIKKKYANLINELITGSYITSNGTFWSALRRLTGYDILIINTQIHSPVLITKENKNSTYKNVDLDYAKTVIDNLNQSSENSATVNPSETESQKIIPLFLNDKHCTPAMHSQNKNMSAKIDCNKLKIQFHTFNKVKSILKPVISTVLTAGGFLGIIFPPCFLLFIPGTIGLISSSKDSIDNLKQSKAIMSTTMPTKLLPTTETEFEENQIQRRPMKSLLQECEKRCAEQESMQYTDVEQLR